MVKVGINGFGRMGRLGLRAGWDMEEFDIVQINEIATDCTGSAHLLKYDSVHGVWDQHVDVYNEFIQIGEKSLASS